MLDAETREALEFDALLQLAARLAQTPLGAQRLHSIQPSSNLEEVRCLQRRTSQAKQWIQELQPSFSGLEDPSPLLAGLTVQDLTLEPAEILLAARYVRRSLAIRRAMKPQASVYPLLWAQVQALPDLSDWSLQVQKALDAEGHVLDSASPNIQKIRAAIAHKRQQLNQRLEKYFVHSEILQDQYITERNGRYVIPVRAERKNEIEGVLHGASSSGATVFLEPLPVVNLNNDLALLLDEETLETQRILRGLSDQLRFRQEDFHATVEIVTDLDATAARARLSADHGGTEPVMGAAGIRFKQSRHPMLIHFLGKQNVVAIDLDLNPEARILVISGPNTGGKTAALKTIGLFAIMAQCGFHLPAAESALPLFETIRADVGDRQSLQENLSTFSSRIVRLKKILEEAGENALVLLDELGAGTDPSQGAALALAVLETLRAQGAHVVATTHLDRLKIFADEAEFAENAAVEFDEPSLKPTFRLLLGVTGQSNALSIAERVGLQKRVVDLARSKMGSQDQTLQRYLCRLQDQWNELEAQKQELQAARRGLEEERQRVTSEKEDELRSRREVLEARFAGLQQEFERALERELQTVQDKLERDRELISRKRKMQALRDSYRKKARGADETAATDLSDTLPANAPVMVISLGRSGIFLGTEGKQVIVEIAGKRVQVARSDLREVGEKDKSRRHLPANVRFIPATDTEVPHELNLIGQTVDEALPKVDKLLDQAYLESYGTVRLIHGRGSGRLRKALRNFLKDHQHVANLRSGKEEEGGEAVTIVELR